MVELADARAMASDLGKVSWARSMICLRVSKAIGARAEGVPVSLDMLKVCEVGFKIDKPGAVKKAERVRLNEERKKKRGIRLVGRSQIYGIPGHEF